MLRPYKENIARRGFAVRGWKGKMTERKDDRMWGGRFERAPNEQFDAFQRSFAFDRRLLPYEIAVDRAWAKALEPIGIFTATEVRQTLAALDKISERARTDAAWLEKIGAHAEDVHHFVEKALVEEVTFAASDERLVRAADAEHLTTLNVEQDRS